MTGSDTTSGGTTSGGRVSVVGEALVDLVTTSAGGEPRAHPGGSPANVALGLARLDVPVTLVTQLGPDAYGDLVREHLTGNGVRLADGWRSTAATSTALARLDAQGRATYEFKITWDPRDLTLPAETTAVHTGSLATLLAPGRDAVVELMRRARAAGVLVSYDPNVRPGLVPDREAFLADVERLVALADIVKLSEEDADWLYPGQDFAERARRWARPLTLMTRGADGVLAVTPDRSLRVPSVAIDLVDTVGAGDAFTAGLLAALGRAGVLTPERLRCASEPQLAAAAGEAALVAALTCARPGADPPTLAELRAAGTSDEHQEQS